MMYVFCDLTTQLIAPCPGVQEPSEIYLSTLLSSGDVEVRNILSNIVLVFRSILRFLSACRGWSLTNCDPGKSGFSISMRSQKIITSRGLPPAFMDISNPTSSASNSPILLIGNTMPSLKGFKIIHINTNKNFLLATRKKNNAVTISTTIHDNPSMWWSSMW